jgi:phosphate starvation-inducible protein PhoH
LRESLRKFFLVVQSLLRRPLISLVEDGIFTRHLILPTNEKRLSEVKELERFAAHDQHLANRLFGQQNAHLKQIEQALAVHLTTRGNEVLIEGEPLAAALTRRTLEELQAVMEGGYQIYPADID